MPKEGEHDLSEVFDFMHDGISSVVSISNDLLNLNDSDNVDDILSVLKEKLKQLNYFDSFAFYKIKDSIDFIQTHVYPEDASKSIEDDVKQHIDNGTFAWALNNTNPIVVSGPVSENNQVLFSLSTKRRIHGMFIANAKNQGHISGVVLDLLQLILSITVFSVENNQLTRQLKIHTLTLEDKVLERTKELEYAKQRAEESSRARSEFLANMSHEIRTPMNGVLGMMELLKATELNEKQLHYVNIAQNSGSNMLVILNDILDLSKYESGKMTLDKEEFNLIDMLDELVSLFAFDLQAKGVELIVDVDPEIPTYLYGGKTRFWQVVMNLLGNAKKFTETGEIYLTLKSNGIEDDCIDIGVSVKDSGIGITEKSLEKVFDSFEQAEVNTTRQYGGTGLGLALCKRLVAMMGGEIKVKSTLGEGSDFFFNVKMQFLPGKSNLSSLKTVERNDLNIGFACASSKFHHALDSVFKRLNLDCKILSLENDVDTFLSNVSSGKTNILIVDDVFIINSNHFERIKDDCAIRNVKLLINCNERNKGNYESITEVIAKPFMANQFLTCLKIILGIEKTSNETNTIFIAKVLVVEDNEVNQIVAKGILSNIGCDVSIANNGQDALDILKENKFDIIFMDINMPVLNGCDTTIQFRKTSVDTEYTPIIALTANVMIEDIEEYYDAGMDDYLSKPFSTKDIQKKLNKWVILSGNEPLSKHDEVPECATMEHFDVVALDKLKIIMEDGFSELVTVYVNNSSELIESIANNNDDFEKLSRDIHSLKGCSGNMGAMKLFSMCNDFELLFHQDKVIDNGEIDKLIDELKFVHEYLEN